MSTDGTGQDTISAPIHSPFGNLARRNTWAVVALRERANDRCHEVPLEARRYTLGKSPSCDVVIDDPYVSNHHCTLERLSDGTLVVRDNGSKNGSYLDGSPVIAAELRPGAVLAIGRTQLVAVGDRNPASALEQLRGRDPRFRAAIDLALRAARSDCSILVVGETGTGKDLVARAIHESSARAHGPFVPINCGAFPRELIGAELFGHVRGAFTGATDARDGVFAQADGGTLFLDELGELPLEQQPNLLRAIEARRVRPIGGADERAIDVRFVAATNRLDGLGTEAAAIRLDLYHRLASVVVSLPPLRARKSDIPELVECFLADLAPRHGLRDVRPEAIDALCAYDWPGNVRELRQTIVRAVSLTDDEIGIADLGLPRPFATIAPHVPRLPTLPPREAPARSLRVADELDGDGLARPERVLREMMAHALARCGSARAAARDLGMAKSTFVDKAHRFGLIGRKRRS